MKSSEFDLSSTDLSLPTFTGEGIGSVPTFDAPPPVTPPTFNAGEERGSPGVSPPPLAASEAPDLPQFSPAPLAPPDSPPALNSAPIPSASAPEVQGSPLPSVADVDQGSANGGDPLTLVAEKLDTLISKLGNGDVPSRLTPADRQTSRWSARIPS